MGFSHKKPHNIEWTYRTLRSMLVFAVAMLMSMMPTLSYSGDFFVERGAGGSYSVAPRTTFLGQRFKDVIKQARDFSCGSAALATLLNFHYGHNVTEDQVLESMFKSGDRQKILKQGFSMLDMKNYLAGMGLKADGFRAPLEKLVAVGIPAIVLLNLNNYLHFVVVRGVSDDEILVADPAYGNKKMTRDQFMQSWNQIVFVITSDMDQGKARFNTAADWRYRKHGEFDTYLRVNNLALSTISAERLYGYY